MKLFISCLFLALLSVSSAFSQDKQLSITGSVVDAQSKSELPYVTVAVLSKTDNKMLTGTTTDATGKFQLKASSENVIIEVSFIGYQKKTIAELNFVNGSANLGVIALGQDAELLKEVEVTAEKSTVEFKLDKRVFNVGKDISSTGMSAMEVLNNVPSVNVDIEGQISLRGNTGVQILINGKPSVLADEGSNALGSITADMIESIEVITNPSAKYEAEGTSGILNIILKKDEKKGFNGSISLNTGIPDNHSVGISLNRRTENFNFFSQMGAGYRSIPTYSESRNENLLDGTGIFSEGTGYRNEQFYNFTLGTDYYINDLNIITLSGNFAYEIEDQPSETNFEFLDSNAVVTSAWRRNETTEATNPKYQYDLQYKREFKNNEDHVLLFSTLGRFFGKDLSSDFVNTTLLGEETYTPQKTETNFYQADYTFKLDYTNPITEQVTIETGALYNINDVGNEYAVFNQENRVFVVDSTLTNNFEFDQRVLGVYGTGSYEGEKWGVKLGLRAENTILNTVLTTTNETNNQNYTNLFPSLHTSYKVSKTMSFQAGYSRRVFRPRLWDLNPFFNIRNNFNIRRGNPDLQPEFGDSYEVTGIFILKKASLNASIYHLYTTNTVERVTYFDGAVSVTTPANVGTSRKTGFEVNGKYTPLKWITFNGDFNYGVFSRMGQFENQDFSFDGDQWSSKLTGKVKLPKGFDVEVSGNYQSRVKTIQGRRSGFLFANAGVRKKLWEGKAVVNLGVQDVFASRIRESFVEQTTFNQYSFSQRGTFLTLGFSYSFGKGEAMTYTGRRR